MAGAVYMILTWAVSFSVIDWHPMSVFQQYVR